jgi:hypothetical protein
LWSYMGVPARKLTSSRDLWHAPAAGFAVMTARMGRLPSAPIRTQRMKQPGSEDDGGTRRIEKVVVALIAEYHQVKVRDADGHLSALTELTMPRRFDVVRHRWPGSRHNAEPE